VSKIAHDAGIPVMIDNTVPSPYPCNPLQHGADIVAHSATRFLGGHGTSIGGSIVDGGQVDFGASGRFSGFTTPDPGYHGLVFWDALGPGSFILEARVLLLRDMGPAMAPLNAFLILPGIETLARRMERRACGRVPRRARPGGVDRLAGLPSSPWYERAKRYTPKGPGSVLAFGIIGGSKAGQRFVESLDLHSHVANIGDVCSLAIHPASTTHSQVSELEQASTGTAPNLVRLSVGIETIEDILADLDRGFEAAAGM